MPDGEEAPAPRRAAAPLHTVRAGIVVAAFLVALILLLGPAGDLTASPPTTTVPTHPTQPVVRSRTAVQVVNGTTATGVAAHYRTLLGQAGWDALNAEDTTPPATASTQKTVTYVYFLPHHQQAAKLVAAELHVTPSHVVLRTQTVLHTVNGAYRDAVVVLLGTDLAH